MNFGLLAIVFVLGWLWSKSKRNERRIKNLTEAVSILVGYLKAKEEE